MSTTSEKVQQVMAIVTATVKQKLAAAAAGSYSKTSSGRNYHQVAKTSGRRGTLIARQWCILWPLHTNNFFLAPSFLAVGTFGSSFAGPTLPGTTDHCHLQRLHICSCAVPVAFPTVLPSGNGALSGTASDASTTVARLHICAQFMPAFSTALRQGGLSRRVQAKGARSYSLSAVLQSRS